LLFCWLFKNRNVLYKYWHDAMTCVFHIFKIFSIYHCDFFQFYPSNFVVSYVKFQYTVKRW
jgi:hypothetical protein